MQDHGVSVVADGVSRPRTAIALHEIEKPIVLKALETWERVRGTRRFPTRGDMSPRAMAGLLTNTAVLRVLDAGDEFIFKIVGDAIRIQQGAALQGKTMAEIDAILPGHGSLLRRIYRGVYEAGKPCAFRGWYLRPADNHPFCHEVVIVPLSEDGEIIDHLIVVAA